MGFTGFTVEQGYSFPTLKSFRGFSVGTVVYKLNELTITDPIGFKTNEEFSNLVVTVEGINYPVSGVYTYGTIDLLEFAIVYSQSSSEVTISGTRQADFSDGGTYSESFSDISVLTMPA